jgi:hypothetical protein
VFLPGGGTGKCVSRTSKNRLSIIPNKIGLQPFENKSLLPEFNLFYQYLRPLSRSEQRVSGSPPGPKISRRIKGHSSKPEPLSGLTGYGLPVMR